jgi:hypothetical protein
MERGHCVAVVAVVVLVCDVRDHREQQLADLLHDVQM